MKNNEKDNQFQNSNQNYTVDYRNGPPTEINNFKKYSYSYNQGEQNIINKLV